MPRQMPRTPLSSAQLLALRPAIDQYLRSRVDEVSEVPDLAQEVLSRVWASRARVTPDGAETYAIRIASNLLLSQARQRELHTRHQPRLYDPTAPTDPALAVTTREELERMDQALAQLSKDDQELLANAYLRDTGTALLRSRSPAMTSRLAAARARARVAYLLCLRRTQLPTPQCRDVLEAVSSGDQRRQRRVGAAEHVASCPVCASCAPALQARRRALFGLVPIPLLARGLWNRYKQAPRSAHVASGAGLAAAIAVAAAAVLTHLPAHGSADAAARQPAPGPTASAGPSPTPSAASPAPSLVLTLDGQLTTGAGTSVAPAAALTAAVRADRVEVLTVPADEGFWVGVSGRRTWVFLRTAGESAAHIQPGDFVSLTGTLQPVTAGSPALAGLEPDEGLTELQSQGTYLEADTVHILPG